MNYYIYYDSDVAGPYTKEQMQEMRGTGILTAESLVFIEGEADWHPFSEIEGLSAAPAASPEPKAPAPAKKALGPKPGMGGGPVAAKKGIGPKPGAAPMKKAAAPAKKAVTAPAAGDGAAAKGMSDAQRTAYEAAMAKKESSGGGKMKLILIIGAVLVAIVAIAGALIYFDIISI